MSQFSLLLTKIMQNTFYFTIVKQLLEPGYFLI